MLSIRVLYFILSFTVLLCLTGRHNTQREMQEERERKRKEGREKLKERDRDRYFSYAGSLPKDLEHSLLG